MHRLDTSRAKFIPKCWALLQFPALPQCCLSVCGIVRGRKLQHAGTPEPHGPEHVPVSVLAVTGYQVSCRVDPIDLRGRPFQTRKWSCEALSSFLTLVCKNLTLVEAPPAAADPSCNQAILAIQLPFQQPCPTETAFARIRQHCPRVSVGYRGCWYVLCCRNHWYAHAHSSSCTRSTNQPATLASITLHQTVRWGHGSAMRLR